MYIEYTMLYTSTCYTAHLWLQCISFLTWLLLNLFLQNFNVFVLMYNFNSLLNRICNSIKRMREVCMSALISTWCTNSSYFCLWKGEEKKDITTASEEFMSSQFEFLQCLDFRILSSQNGRIYVISLIRYVNLEQHRWRWWS